MPKAIIVHYLVPEHFVELCRMNKPSISAVKISELFAKYIEQVLRYDQMEFFIKENMDN